MNKIVSNYNNTHTVFVGTGLHKQVMIDTLCCSQVQKQQIIVIFELNCFNIIKVGKENMEIVIPNSHMNIREYCCIATLNSLNHLLI